MYCTKCGAELKQEAKFCVVCGAPATQSVENEPVIPANSEAPVQQETPPPKEPVKIDVNEVKETLIATVKPLWEKVKPFLTNKKVLLGIGAVVVALIVASVISAILSSGNGYVKLDQSIRAVPVDGQISIIVDKKVLKDKVDATRVDESNISLDGKVMAFTTDENELYVVSGKKLKLVAEDVDNFELSTSGKGIAYVVKDDNERALYLYNVGNGKPTTISEELGSMTYVIAPDGKSVAYFVENGDEDELMFSNGKNAVTVTSSECELYGISNNGKYIYVSRENDDGNDTMYVYNTKGDSSKLGSISSSVVYFNEDHTQVLFYNDGKTYISTKGKDAEKASSDRLSMIIAPNASTFHDGSSFTYPVSNLYDHVYTTSNLDGYTVWMIKKNADKNQRLVSKITNCQLDATAEYLYYIHSGNELRVIKISDGEKASDRYTRLAKDVDGFIVTSDRKYVYYGSDDSIYSVNGKKGGRPTIVCSDDVEDIAINGKDVLYYIVDGDLYATNNGKKGSKVIGDIHSVDMTPNGVVYAANDDTIFVSDGSKKPSKLMNKE